MSTHFRFIILQLLLLGPFYLLAQERLPSEATHFPLPLFFNDSSLSSGAIVQIEAKNLNQGLIHNPIELLQGKVAGVMIARPGSEPNALPDIRLRGYTGLGGSNPDPIYIVDGVPNVDISTIDPADVQKITVIKDAASAAIYGLQGGNGIILIETMRADTQAFRLSYQGRAAMEQRILGNPVADAERFVQDGGFDLGSETDWREAISRDAFSQSHHLRLDHNNDRGQMYASANFRQAQGLLRDNGFEQYNFRFGGKQSFWEDRISTGLNLTFSQRNTQHTNPSIIRYATIYNPTAPIRSDAAEFERFGGYFQQNLFDYYNPVAIQEQQEFLNRDIHLYGSFHLTVEATPWLQIKTLYSRQAATILMSQVFQPENRPSDFPNGVSIRNGIRYNRNLDQVTARVHHSNSNWNVEWLLGYGLEKLSINTKALSTPEVLPSSFSYGGLDDVNLVSPISAYATGLDTYTFVSQWSQLGLSFQDKFSLQASVRRDGTSLIASDDAFSIYPAISLAYNFAPYLDLAAIKILKLRAGWGITGNISRQGGLSQTYFHLNPSYSRGRYQAGLQTAPQPNSEFAPIEKVNELNFGFDLALYSQKLGLHLDLFFQNIAHTYWASVAPIPPSLFGYQIYAGPSQSRVGLEIALDATLIQKQKFSWQSALTTTLSLKEEIGLYDDGSDFRRYLASAGSPNANSQQVLIHQTDQAPGSIVGYIVDEVNFNTPFTYIDLNQDGFLDEEDQVILGSSLPKAFFGLSNQLRWGQWSLNALIESYIGHSIANMNRFFYENNDISTQSINYVLPPYWDERVNPGNVISSYFVEEAGFIRLRHLSLSRTIIFPQKGKLEISLMAQNLLTITNYTGANPEVRLQDLRDGNPSATGIDRRATYPLGKAFILGLNFSL